MTARRSASELPGWAENMADLHVHAAPSLLPRHGNDAQTADAQRQVGFGTVVLKSHEGSTVERAAALGAGVYGGVVLNSPVGGANPDAVEVAARLGGRVVWMPTVSAPNHKHGASSPEHVCLVVHDIDKAQAYYESIGIGPWQQYPPLTEYTDLDVPEPDAFAQLLYRFVDLDNVQLQLCQPPQFDCPQRRFLDRHGEGVFHLGFECEIDDAVAIAASLGMTVLMRGQRPDGSGFVYFDTQDDAAVVLETRKSPAS